MAKVMFPTTMDDIMITVEPSDVQSFEEAGPNTIVNLRSGLSFETPGSATLAIGRLGVGEQRQE